MTPPPDPADLLRWYDRHRRDLPWRTREGEAADPYRVWLSEIMLQQTTVAAVRPYFAAFLARFPTLPDLAAAPDAAVMSAWAGLGYYSRARNLLACARTVVAEHGGHFPDTAAGLRALPGIGAYTAGAIAAIAFGRQEVAVDGNVERVMARLYRIEDPLPGGKKRLAALATALVPADRPGDFAQAVMDLGATICTPRRPACALCPWTEPCLARRDGVQDTLPKEAAKREGAVRRGAAFVAVRADGAVLLRTRPARGLLGGMAEPPTSAWRADYDWAEARADAPLPAAWTRLDGTVVHVFTHFPLELAVFAAQVGPEIAAPAGARWVDPEDLPGEALPTLMLKVLEHAGLGPASLTRRAPPGSRARR